jgi:hypothetical protein
LGWNPEFRRFAVKQEREVEEMKGLMTVVLSMVFAVGMAGMAVAGSIDSPGAPGSAASKMPAVGDIYNYLTTGTPVPTPGTSFTEPSSGPGSTGNTLTEIYAAVATPFPQCDAAVGDVRSGKKFFSTQSGSWGVQTGTMAAGGGLLKTGQTTSYRTGDDGDLEEGTAFDLSIGTNDTVNDAVTGLQWQAGTEPGTMTWNDAIDWANNLVMDGKADWRLPNATELQTLAIRDASQSVPRINKTMFPNAYSDDYYWTSTTQASATTRALGLHFGGPYLGDRSKNLSYYVRAVRGGQ